MFFNYNTIENLQICKSIVDEASTLLYYSHIPTAIIAMIIGIFVFIKGRKELIGKIMLFITLLFAAWSFLDLFVWLEYDNSTIVMLLWSFFPIIHILIYVLSLYFVFVFANKKDVSLTKKIIAGILILPVILFTFTTFNLEGFNPEGCVAIEGALFTNYYLYLSLLISIFIIIYGIYKYKRIDIENKRPFLLLIIGMESFLLVFFMMVFGVSYLIESGFISDNNYSLEQYGLFSMPVFMAFLSYLIVKFKAFNIKLLASRALIFSIFVLTVSQFLFIKIPTNRMLTAVNLIIIIIIGIYLDRNVKKIDLINEAITQSNKLLRKANLDLETANLRQAETTSLITHQIRGVFTNTIVGLEAIKDGEFGPVSDEIKVILQKIFTFQQKGVKHVEVFLRAQKVESGSIQYDMKDFDLKKVVSEIVDQYTRKAEEVGIKLSSVIDYDEFMVFGDQIYIGEVISNLVDNAIIYTKDSPVKNIDIKLTRENDKVIFKIKDTGIGIKDEDKQKMFTKYGHGKDSRRYNTDTTGLGLFIGKGIVDAHKGKIHFESEGIVGKGTEFTLELPIKNVSEKLS